MWERFTKEAKLWVHYAQCEAGRFGVYAVSPEHFLLALLREGKDDPALALLRQLGADPEALVVSVEEQMEHLRNGTQVWPPRPQRDGTAGGTSEPASIPINEETLREFALDAYSMHLMPLVVSEAARRNKTEVGSLYILLGLIRQDQIRRDELLAIRLFAGTEITLSGARAAVAALEGYEVEPPAAPNLGIWGRLLGRRRRIPPRPQ